MKTTKLYQLLKNIKGKEWRTLKKATQSPIMGGSEQLHTLLLFLQSYHPRYPEGIVLKEAAHAHLFINQPYDDATMRKLYSQLRAIIEHSLVFHHLQHNDFDRDQLLANIYKEKGLGQLYEQKHHQLVESLEQGFLSDSEDLLKKANLLKEWGYHHKADFRKANQIQHQYQQTLAQFFLAENNLLKVDHLVVSQTLRESSDFPLNEIIQQLQIALADAIPLNIQLYSQLIELIEQQNERIYQDIQDTFFQNISLFAPKDRMVIFSTLTNFCIHQRNRGNSQYNYLLFELYKLGLENKILTNQDGKLTEVTYRNIGALCSLIKEFDWGYSFLEDYQDKVISKDIVEIKNLAIATLKLKQGLQHEAIALIYNTRFKKLNNELLSKSILLRCYFELFLYEKEFYPLIKTTAQSFKTYIRRKNVAEIRSVRYLAFIAFVNKISSFIHNKKDYKKSIDKWLTEVNDHSNIFGKEWLIETLSQLKK